MQACAGRCLLCAGRAAADASGVGHHDAERLFGRSATTEHEGEIAAAGAAIGLEPHVAPTHRTLDRETPGVTSVHKQWLAVGLVVMIVIGGKQPAVIPALFIGALVAIATGAEHGVLPCNHGRFAGVMQGADEVGLCRLQLAAIEQAPETDEDRAEAAHVGGPYATATYERPAFG